VKTKRGNFLLLHCLIVAREVFRIRGNPSIEDQFNFDRGRGIGGSVKKVHSPGEHAKEERKEKQRWQERNGVKKNFLQLRSKGGWAKGVTGLGLLHDKRLGRKMVIVSGQRENRGKLIWVRKQEFGMIPGMGSLSFE